MTIDLYVTTGSPPCRTVLLAVKVLNIPVNVKEVDMSKKEHLTPEYLKINPQHTVPTLVDDGFSVWESRAIITYLANKYAKGSTLYPEDPKARALVDQRLYFDNGTLYQSFATYFYPYVFGSAAEDPEKKAKVEEALKFLDTFLEGQKFVAGPKLTLADLSLISTVSTFEISTIDIKKYVNIKKWLETVWSEAPGCEEINAQGVAALKGYVENFLKNRK